MIEEDFLGFKVDERTSFYQHIYNCFRWYFQKFEYYFMKKLQNFIEDFYICFHLKHFETI